MDRSRQRRASTRHEIPAGWTTTYRVVHPPDQIGPNQIGWREARLVDLTPNSVAIEPSGLAPDEELAGTVEINIVAPGQRPTGVLLRGELRHATSSPAGTVRVGLSFRGLDTRKTAFLDLLDQLSAAHEAPAPAR